MLKSNQLELGTYANRNWVRTNGVFALCRQKKKNAYPTVTLNQNILPRIRVSCRYVQKNIIQRIIKIKLQNIL